MIPGLALNPSVMGKLIVQGLPSTYIRWIEPEPEESMSQYATRIANLYRIERGLNHVFVGHSFGGLLAQHLGQLFPKSRVIILSSVKSNEELPRAIRFLRHGYAYHLASKTMIKRSFKLWGWYHGYKDNSLREALMEELDTLGDTYLIWAYKQLIYWKSLALGNPLLHIHGSRDKTFPVKNITRCKVIKGGDHLMVAKRCDLINQLIREFLS